MFGSFGDFHDLGVDDHDGFQTPFLGIQVFVDVAFVRGRGRRERTERTERHRGVLVYCTNTREHLTVSDTSNKKSPEKVEIMQSV